MNEKYLNEEKVFRNLVKKAVKIYFARKEEPLNEEMKFRKLIRNLIVEVAVEDSKADPHEYTGINFLRRMFKNSSFLSTLKELYLTNTTDPSQRESFRAHVITWCIDVMKNIKANDSAPENINKYDEFKKIRKKNMNLTEALDVEFLDVEDEGAQAKAEKEVADAEKAKKEKEAELSTVPNQDDTGRNTAAMAYNEIEGNIVRFYAPLSNEDDQEIFADWLITNLKMYFDKWEKELSSSVKEPTNSEYEEQVKSAEAEASPPPAPEAPPEAAAAPAAEVPAAEAPIGDTPEGGIPPDIEAEINKLAAE